MKGQTLQHGLLAKWLWGPAQEGGGNAASAAGVTRRQLAHGDSASRVALKLIGTCAAAWGEANVNLAAQRERGASWRGTWGASLERGWGAVTPHIEAFGIQHSAPVFQGEGQ